MKIAVASTTEYASYSLSDALIARFAAKFFDIAGAAWTAIAPIAPSAVSYRFGREAAAPPLASAQRVNNKESRRRRGTPSCRAK
jgi:hypothetical protein